MGQYQSLLKSTQVIEVKKQAAVTDLLGAAIWYYDPIAGRNLWGNRAALQLYGVSRDGFCAQQQAAWQAAGGTAAAAGWEESNQQLAVELRRLGASGVQDEQLCSKQYSIRAKALRAGNIQHDLEVHAAFLPLPEAVMQVSATARPCTILYKKKRLRAYQVHVKYVQHKHDTRPLATASNEVAKLQFQLTQQLNQQPDVIPAASLQQPSRRDPDSLLHDLTDGSAHILAQALQRQTTSSTTSTSINHQSSSRLGLQSSGSWSERLAPAPGLRQQSRSLDSSGPQCWHVPSAGASAYLRRVSEKPAATHTGPVKGTSVDRLLSVELGRQSAIACSGQRWPPLEGPAANLTEHLSRTSASSISAAPCGNTAGALAADAAQLLEHPYLRNNSNSISVVLASTPEEQQERHQRLIEMCDNHAMFQFLFDADGKLLTANKRALNNMREHLGEHAVYTMPQYLSIGQCDGGLSAEDLFQVIRTAIFVNQEPSFRLPQLRWSKRRPGKCRWVLYEVWPMEDPVSGTPALLVTEQNITQVKAVEEEYSNQMRQLETQLEEAILQQQQAEAAAAQAAAAAVAAGASAGGNNAVPAFDTCSAAEKTLQLLDKLLHGECVSMEEAQALRTAIVEGGSSLHAPAFLDEQVLSHTQAYAPEVGASLLQMLSSRVPWKDGKDPLPDYGEVDALPCDSTVRSSPRCGQFGSINGSVGNALQLAPGTNDTKGDSRLSQLLPTNDAVSTTAVSGGSESPFAGDIAVLPAERPMRSSVTSVSAYPVITVDSSSRRPSNSSVVVAASGGSLGPAVTVVGGLYSRGAVAAAAREVLSVASTPTTELEAVLALVDNWQFDSFALSAVSGGRPLSSLGFFLLQRSGLVKTLSLDETRLARWLVRLEDGYRANPYHNRIHAADVLRSAHVLMMRGGCTGAQDPDEITLLAVYLAAIVHDFEHRGVTNDYLVRTGDGLALLYNDRSPHENHHLAASWGQLVEYNFLRALPLTSKELVRRLVIEMVLATDMKQHFAIHGLFQSKLHLMMAPGTNTSVRSPVVTMAGDSAAAAAQLSQAASAVVSFPSMGSRSRTYESLSAPNSRQHVLNSDPAASAFQNAVRAGSVSGDTNSAAASTAVAAGRTSSSGVPTSTSLAAGSSFIVQRLRRTSSTAARVGAGAAAGKAPVLEEDAETRSLYLQMCLKTADLGHLAAVNDVHRKWVEALEEENFRQGDREKAANMTVSPLMDRTRGGITQSQLGFFDIVALPLFRSMVQRFPNAKPMLDGVLENYNMWKENEVQ